MPATSTATKNNITLTFAEADHSYVDDRHQAYTSVTTLIGKYFPKFDAPSTAARMESQGKGKAADLIAQWDRTRDEACTYGTRVHETAEAILNAIKACKDPRAALPHDPTSKKEKKAFSLVWRYIHDKIYPNCKIIGTEVMVFDPRWYIAGTIDLAVKLPDGTIGILDWKTNREITPPPFGAAAAKDPIAHLPDASLTKYSLQLNIYQQILINNGYLPRNTKFIRSLFHISVPTDDGGEVITDKCTVTPIKIPDMSTDALRIILDYTHDVPF